jgi:hypothetical protein
MARELAVRIPHDLGTEEAARRLRAGLDRICADYGGHLSRADIVWRDYCADIQIAALGQSVGGEIAVQSDHVEVTVYLPVLLSGLAERIGLFIRARGEESLRIEESKKS